MRNAFQRPGRSNEDYEAGLRFGIDNCFLVIHGRVICLTALGKRVASQAEPGRTTLAQSETP
jgi:hypothetical protein